MRALDDILQITDHRLLPEGRMDGVIVAGVHDEFRGMGLSGVRGFVGEGVVVVDVRGMIEGKEAEGRLVLFVSHTMGHTFNMT